MRKLSNPAAVPGFDCNYPAPLDRIAGPWFEPLRSALSVPATSPLTRLPSTVAAYQCCAFSVKYTVSWNVIQAPFAFPHINVSGRLHKHKGKKSLSRFDLKVQASTARHTRSTMGMAARKGTALALFYSDNRALKFSANQIANILFHHLWITQDSSDFQKKSMHYACWKHPRSNTGIFKEAKAIVKWSHFPPLRFLIFFSFFLFKWTAFELDTLQKRGDKYIKLWLILSSQKVVCICFATSLLNIPLYAWEVTWIPIFLLLLFQLDGKKRKKKKEKASPCVASVCLGGDDDVTERAPASQKGRQEATETGITCSGWM